MCRWTFRPVCMHTCVFVTNGCCAIIAAYTQPFLQQITIQQKSPQMQRKMFEIIKKRQIKIVSDLMKNKY